MVMPDLDRHGLVLYPFPLREDQIVFLKLPPDLTRRDVARLKAYLDELVIDPLPAGE